MAVLSLLVTFFSIQSLTYAAPPPAVLYERALFQNDYAPASTSCPSTPLVRLASNISSDEANYITSRRRKADPALAAWLWKQGNFSTASLPSLGFTASGGSYRALLAAAGVMQGFDARDTTASTGGIYQGLTYQAGLSGGSWFLSSLAGNNWPTVTYLREKLWEETFEKSLLVPATLLKAGEYIEILGDLTAKEDAGFDVTIIDAWGQLLSYQLLPGNTGGDNIRLSGLAALSNFTSFNVPYPIITALGVDRSYEGQCNAYLNATQYEFHPYEWGSWDQGVSAFAKTKYMGSKVANGVVAKGAQCTEYYDNIGYIFGTSSDIFTYALCDLLQPFASIDQGIENAFNVVLNGSGIPEPLKSATAPLANVLEAIVNDTSAEKEPKYEDLFGLYPNPFYQYPPSTTVNQNELITMVDGGIAGQNVPIWPFIQPERDLGVLIAIDSSADTEDSYPNGTEIHQTYLNAQAAGLTKMPFIPTADVFVQQGLNKRATFFGCDDPDTITLIWLPNMEYTYPSNVSTTKITYSKEETRKLIENGENVARQNGTEGWSFCLACGIMGKAGAGEECQECFDQYCYRQNGSGSERKRECKRKEKRSV